MVVGSAEVMSWQLALRSHFTIYRGSKVPLLPYRSTLSSSIKRFEIIDKRISGFLDALV